MSVAASSIRNTQVIASTSPLVKQNVNDYNIHKKAKKEDNCVPVVKSTTAENSPGNHQNTQQNGLMNNAHSMNGTTTPNQTEMDYTQSITCSGLTSSVNGVVNSNNTYNNMVNGGTNGLTNGYQQYPVTNGMNGMTQNSMDTAGPLPNEIFELLNEFWRPNEMVSPDTNLMNGKFSRRSPDGSLEDTAEEEKEVDDDITSLADAEIGVDRNTQKRRYSRLSDGYERLKSVLPSVKDKRRVSKARILDEAINYIQRLESITNVLKREHEKRLSMLNGSNGFFPDYSVQPYMRSLFQKQMYPPGMTSSKMSQYPKMSTTPSTMPKSPRMKQYSNQYNSQAPALGVGTNMTSTDYNYNNLNNYSATSSLYQPSDPNQIMNGDTSPITNNSPYSACSLSPGSTPTTYQNGSGVNNSWPYQGGTMTGFNDTNSTQLSSYSQSRQATTGYGGSNYTNLNGSMWGNMGMNDNVSQVADHSMKVG